MRKAAFKINLLPDRPTDYAGWAAVRSSIGIAAVELGLREPPFGQESGAMTFSLECHTPKVPTYWSGRLANEFQRSLWREGVIMPGSVINLGGVRWIVEPADYVIVRLEEGSGV